MRINKFIKKTTEIYKDIVYSCSIVKKNIINRIRAYDFECLYTKQNIAAGTFFLFALSLLTFTIIYYCNVEDRYILGDIKFGDSSSVVVDKCGDDYSKLMDIADGAIILKYKNYKVNGVKGSVYYYFSDNNTVNKIVFSFEGSKKDVSKIYKYLKRHYGKADSVDNGRYIYDGRKVKYELGMSPETYLHEVTISNK